MDIFEILFGNNRGNVSKNPKLPRGYFSGGYQLGKHNLVLSNKPRVVIPESLRCRHTLILGGSGYGKTNLIKNIIEQDIASGSGLIVLDPKNDLKKFMFDVADHYNRIDGEGAKTVFHSLNLDGSESETWNPLQGDNPAAIANRLFLALFDDGGTNAFYESVSGNLLTNIITLLKATGKKINLRDVFSAVLNEDILEQLVRRFENDNRLKVEINVLKKDFLDNKAAEAHKLSIGLRNKLQPLITSPWSDLINSYSPDIDIQEIIEKGHILHFGISTDIIGENNYKPLAKLFMAYVKEAAGIRYNKQIKKHCTFICDEFGDIANDDFVEGVKKYRSAGISFVLGFQDIGDLKEHGEPYLIKLMTSTSTKIIFGIPEPISADYLAKMLGTYKDDIVAAQSYNAKGEVKGTSERVDDRKFKVDPDSIKNLDVGECVSLMPYTFKGERVIYNFKASLIDKNKYDSGDYEYYKAFWHNVPQDKSCGLGLDAFLNKKDEENGNISDEEKPKKRVIRKKIKIEGTEEAPSVRKHIRDIDEALNKMENRENEE